MPKYIWDDDQQAVVVAEGSYRYRSKWACCRCRKSFTRVRESPDPDEVKCPDCGRVAIDMGHLFEAPAKRDLRSWKITEILGKNHLGFSRAGNVAFIKTFITQNGEASPAEVQKNIDRHFKRKTP